jgi:tRNA C32,U32 (ribose-2'-O)-methylase TrmJ
MNLAQAAAVLAYEVALAADRERRADGREADGRVTDGRESDGRVTDGRESDGRESDGQATDATGPVPGPPVRHETLEALWRRLEAVLGAAGYLNPQNPGAVLAEWRALLARAEPTQREVELLVAAARALERALGLAGRGRDG